jgi:hypothetical protein
MQAPMTEPFNLSEARTKARQDQGWMNLSDAINADVGDAPDDPFIDPNQAVLIAWLLQLLDKQRQRLTEVEARLDVLDARQALASRILFENAYQASQQEQS